MSQDLRHFLEKLKQQGDLQSVAEEISPQLEMTEVSRRTLHQDGPALLFQKPVGHTIPVLTNLFGSSRRIFQAMQLNSLADLRELGRLLAFLKEPEPPKGLGDLWDKFHQFKQVLNMPVRLTGTGSCQQNQYGGKQVNLGDFPVQTCWPGDAAPLITWGVVVTKGPRQSRENLGIYRLQVIDRHRVIMRWLAHRGGALDFRDWQQHYSNEPFPVSVFIGADPATLLAAVTPIPDTLSEYSFAGLLRGEKSELVRCIDNPLRVPAHAEMVLEGYIYPDDYADEGPFGDHTGYYNEVERFPVMTIERITHRDDPIYHSTYTGRPPDEPAVLGVALNELFIPILQKQFPEIIDFYLPPEGCSYRLAVVSIRKQYPGHAKRIFFGIWSFLRQFLYTKFVIVVDEDINIRHWHDIIWAMTTRVDPARDTLLIEQTPIDYLDFASPVSGLGSKMGIDATNKWPGESQRVWGKALDMSPEVVARIDLLWEKIYASNTPKS